MMLQVGIVGLANVGKSTLFNALLKKQAALVANYPFATIEPNVGIVPVPDNRLNELAKFFNNPPIVPATVKFVDIAGLVKGASQGAGLGNKFLANIREVDLICEVVRDFNDENIIREGSVSPKDDIELIKTELELADLEAKEGAPPLATKPILYVYNTTYKTDSGRGRNDDVVEIDAKIESELAGFSNEEEKELLKEYGLEEPGLNRLIKKAYEMLGLISFLTAGDKEVRAWTIKNGTKAPAAAGVIHTDFEKNFIKAEVISFDDYISCNGERGVKEQGKMRLEGREYEVKDGDVIEFKVGV
ncbi:MAG: redox-regulated ATPase YchF [bacterium]|nr:redox-regulated ATPase YchF [bacterium]